MTPASPLVLVAGPTASGAGCKNLETFTVARGRNGSGWKCGHSGFTLIELLVVIGMIVILVGGVGMALAGRGDEGAALTTAQSLVGTDRSITEHVFAPCITPAGIGQQAFDGLHRANALRP